MSDLRIDLHLHSNHSDGSESPATVMRAAKNAGLDVAALTDHDTTSGWDEAREAATDLGMTFVPGLELSTKVAGGSAHLLGYLVDPTNAELVAECDRVRDNRATRIARMVDNIHEDFGGITLDYVLSFAKDGATLGRPVIARALVDQGIVATVSEAFDDILSSGSKYYVKHYAPTLERGIEVIAAAGGVPVLAHPWTDGRTSLVDPNATDDDVEAVFATLADIGLAGLEVHHEENTLFGRQRLAEIAAHLGLIVTGSSDYHGAPVKPVLPGAHTTSPANFERILALGTGSAAS